MIALSLDQRCVDIAEEAVDGCFPLFRQAPVEQRRQAEEATGDNNMADQADRNNEVDPLTVGQWR